MAGGRSLAVMLLVGMCLPGCYLSHTLDDAGRDGGMDAPLDAPLDVPPTVDGGFRCDGGRPLVRGDIDVDVLFVIDNSPSMIPKQASLAEEVPRLVEALATGDTDGDRVQDFPVPRSLHAGVVTTAGLGLMEAVPGGGLWLELDTAGGDTGAFATAVRRTIQVGADGPILEKPIIAALRALTPSTDIPPGVTEPVHGDTEHAGFLREGSVLVVLILTDEDDCSDDYCYENRIEQCLLPMFPMPDFCDPRNELRNVDLYAAAMRRLKPDGNLVVGVLAGVPAELVAGDAEPDYDAILADPRMRSPTTEMRLVVACDSATRGGASPARRLLALVEQLGEGSVLRSICQADFSTVLTPVIDLLGEHLRRESCR